MLDMKTACERCGTMLPAESAEACICSYECTFCTTCADAMQGQCPNCGGVLRAKPSRMRKQDPDDVQAALDASPDPAHSPFPTAEAYSAERALFGSLTVVDLQDRQSRITDRYRNEVIANVDAACLRLAVFQEEYRWHCHPDSDELFLVVEGTLEIDLEDRTVQLAPWQLIVIPAGTVHRTRAVGRTVNATFEQQGARTVFLDAPAGSR